MREPGRVDPRLTEARNPRTLEIDRADTNTIVRLIQADDRDVPEAVASQATVIARVIDDVVVRFRRGGRLVYVGAGTSGRLGTLDASECPPTFGVPPGLVRAVIAGGPSALVESSEGAEDDPEGGVAAIRGLAVGPSDFVLGIATSGTTPYVHGALGEAAAARAGTGFLCCSEPPDDIASLVDHLIVPLVGPEVIAGSTRMKAGTATKLILNTITTGAMIRSGRVYENLMVDLRARSAKLVDRGIRIVMAVTGLGRPEARSLLVDAGGAVKTALAMHMLDTNRALAERALDAADGFLAAAIGNVEESPGRYYGDYPAAPGSPGPERLLRCLADGPAEVAAAREEARRIDEADRRVPVSDVAWTAGQHAVHLLDFERGAVRPRVTAWMSAPEDAEPEAFADWEPDRSPPPDAEFESALAAFAREREATLGAIPQPVERSLVRRARIGRETVTLYQFLRGIAQHDAAHALRVRERVHASLLQGDDS